MLELTLPEQITFALFVLTTTFLLVVAAAESERAQSIAAWCVIPFGLIATIGLWACTTGRADAWYDEHLASKQPVQKASAVRVSRQPLKRDEPKIFRECSVCPEMVVIPEGYGFIGASEGDALADASEKPRRVLRIAKPFALGRSEVTNEEFQAFLKASGRTAAVCSREFGVEPGQPANCLSWNEARDYTIWLSKKTGQTYRLPTSAEWEYAARVRTETAYSFGNTLADGAAHVEQIAGSPKAVRSFPANGFGVFDLTGNVAEMVWDCWLPTLRDVPTDGSAYLRGNCATRTLRDAAWFESSALARASARRPINVHETRPGVGFRVMREM